MLGETYLRAEISSALRTNVSTPLWYRGGPADHLVATGSMEAREVTVTETAVKNDQPIGMALPVVLLQRTWFFKP